jgi:hypothetical protein
MILLTTLELTSTYSDIATFDSRKNRNHGLSCQNEIQCDGISSISKLGAGAGDVTKTMECGSR